MGDTDAKHSRESLSLRALTSNLPIHQETEYEQGRPFIFCLEQRFSGFQDKQDCASNQRIS
jgi:hypothetical protein